MFCGFSVLMSNECMTEATLKSLVLFIASEERKKQSEVKGASFQADPISVNGNSHTTTCMVCVWLRVCVCGAIAIGSQRGK